MNFVMKWIKLVVVLPGVATRSGCPAEAHGPLPSVRGPLLHRWTALWHRVEERNWAVRAWDHKSGFARFLSTMVVGVPSLARVGPQAESCL